MDWSWNQQKRIFTLYDSILDFRSADQPENIEGFGYKKIILNEAGIILQDDYLYSNAILPMMMDYSDSQLIAGGKPKGKVKKDGNPHKFYQLWQEVEKGNPLYWGKQYSTYENPFLSVQDIHDVENEVSELEAQQEIYGQFTESSGTNPFAHQYNVGKHESEQAVLRRELQLIISIDFNINPFAITFHHNWQDQKGSHHHVVGEKSIENGSIPAMIDYINQNYGYWIPACMITGDSMGNNRQINQADLSSFFTQLQRGLRISTKQVNVPHNPFHLTSRNDVNYFLLHFQDFKINPKLCPETCKDMKRVQWDGVKNQILKLNRKDVAQRADFLDTIRSVVNTIHKPWINIHSKRAA